MYADIEGVYDVMSSFQVQVSVSFRVMCSILFSCHAIYVIDFICCLSIHI